MAVSTATWSPIGGGALNFYAPCCEGFNDLVEDNLPDECMRRNGEEIGKQLQANGVEGRRVAARTRRRRISSPQVHKERVEEQGGDTRSMPTSADNAWERIEEIPDNIYGLGGRVKIFLRKEYGIDKPSSDFGKFTDDFLDVARYAGKQPVDSSSLIAASTDGDGVDYIALRRSMLRLLLGDGFCTNPRQQQLFVRLQRLLYNEDGLLNELKLIGGRSLEEPKRRVEGLSIFASGPMDTNELRRLAIDAVIVEEVRQEPQVGSCFAAAPYIQMQADETALAMRICRQLLCEDGIALTNDRGATVFVPTNCYEFRGQGYGAAKILQHAIVRTLADASALCGYRPMDPSAEEFLVKIDEVGRMLRRIDPQIGKLSCDIAYDSAAACINPGAHNISSEIRGIWVPHITIEGDPELQSLVSNRAMAIIEKRVNGYESELQVLLASRKKTLRDGEGDGGQLRDEIGRLSKKITECQLALAKLSYLARSYRAVCGGWPDHIVNLLNAGTARPPVHLVFIGKQCYRNCEEVFAEWFRVMVAAAGEPTKILICGIGHAYSISPVLSPRLMRAIKDARISGDTNGEFDRLIGEVKNDGKRIMFIDPNLEKIDGIGVGAFGSPPSVHLFVRRNGMDYPFSPTTSGCDCFFRNLGVYKQIERVAHA